MKDNNRKRVNSDKITTRRKDSKVTQSCVDWRRGAAEEKVGKEAFLKR